MKRLLILLLLLLLLISCGSPEQPEGGLIMEEPTDCSALEAKYNDLASKYTTVEVNYKLLKAYSDTLRENYITLLNSLDVRSQDYYKDLAREMALHQELQERFDEVWEKLNCANDRGDIIISDNMTLSDNLTESELEMFYKGWDLWWETLEE